MIGLLFMPLQVLGRLARGRYERRRVWIGLGCGVVLPMRMTRLMGGRPGSPRAGT
jgi:hypothetical protein